MQVAYLLSLEIKDIVNGGRKYFITSDKHILTCGQFRNLLAFHNKPDFEREFTKMFLKTKQV